MAVYDVELWPVDKVKPYGENPRKIPESAIKRLQPLSKSSALGNLLLWMAMVPVHVSENLTPEKIRA